MNFFAKILTLQPLAKDALVRLEGYAVGIQGHRCELALLSAVISTVALIRTRRFEAKQLAFQETADRLTRMQTDILGASKQKDRLASMRRR
jgi:hypothetical protein